MKVNELLTLEISDLALGGKAVSHVDGRVVFVDRGLPGDGVEARVSRAKRSYAEARLERVVRPSRDRVPARCPHVPRCGGCRMQDLDYAQQLRLKQTQVVETLRHLGGIAEPPVRPIVPAPETFHYRNKMEFSFDDGLDGRPLLGLHERGSFDRIFPLETCLLPSPLTVEVVRLTQAHAVAQQWRAYRVAAHTGIVRFLAVRHLPHTDQCSVQLIATQEPPGLEAWAKAVAALSPAVKTVTLGIQRSRANIAFAESERALIGDGTILERLLGLEFAAGAGAFLQTNSRQAEALYRAALEAGQTQAEDTVLDLYCGTGTLTLLFARHCREAIGVESVPEAVELARANAARNRIGNTRFVAGEARPVLRAWARGERPDAPRPGVVVLDPPRAGLHPRVVARTCELRPRRIVYVSCNPATLARDLKDFAAGGYALRDLIPFDMFPHTPHIECVARLER